MMFKAFLIKYGEIGLKGKNRYIFEDALMRQIRFSMKHIAECKVTKEMCIRDRIWMELQKLRGFVFLRLRRRRGNLL